MKLPIENMVLPFWYAKYLKDKGVKQQSLYYWVVREGKGIALTHHPNIDDLVRGKEVADRKIPENYYSAFLTEEVSFILEDNKPFNLEEADIRCRYYDTYFRRDFVVVGNFARLLIEAMKSHEEHQEYIRSKQPNRAPKTPKNPNTNGNFR